MAVIYKVLEDENIDYDIFISYKYNGYDWTVSLRTENPDILLYRRAATYGGGGHAGAAGFHTKNIEMLLP